VAFWLVRAGCFLRIGLHCGELPSHCHFNEQTHLFRINPRLYPYPQVSPHMSRATMIHRHHTALALAAALAAACFVSNALAQAPAQPAKPPAKPAAPPPAAAAPAPAAPQPTLLGQFGDWGAYTASPGGKKVCFALGKPSSSKTTPPNRPRDPAYMFISSRPSEKVREEVSIIFGYGFKPNSDASIEISGANYAMYTQADGAWVKNAAEEPRLVDAMRKGVDVTVKGTSAKGTASIDTYSLRGLPEALNRVGQECK
jgi:invasion protein IalB